MTWLLRFVLNLRDNFLTRRNILATNQIARKTIEPFENNNKRSQGRLGEGGPLTHTGPLELHTCCKTKRSHSMSRHTPRGYSAWVFWGVSFQSRDFLGVLLEALGIFLGFAFCPHSIIPITRNPEYPSWGPTIAVSYTGPSPIVYLPVQRLLPWSLFAFVTCPNSPLFSYFKMTACKMKEMLVLGRS